MEDKSKFTLNKMEILRKIEESTSKDLAHPQRLTDDEEASLNLLDEKYPDPAEKGSEDQEFEKFLKDLENDHQ